MDNNDVINKLKETIVKNLDYKLKLDVREDLDNFLESDVSVENKEKLIELLYQFQLFSDAYLGPDPRAINVYSSHIFMILKVKNNEEFKEKINSVEELVKTMKYAELNPIETMKKQLEDEEKYKNVLF